MTAFERMARLGDRVFDRLRDKRAFALSENDAVDGDFESVRGQEYAVLVTFRRNGEAVPSPIWPGVDERGNVYLKTRHDVGKVKRIANDSRVLIAPSSLRGKPTGPAVRGTARVLPPDEWAHAEQTLAAAHGATRKMSERVLGGPEELAAYVEIRPGR